MKTVIVEESPFPMRTINSMGAYATSRNGLTNSGKTDKLSKIKQQHVHY